MARPNHQFEKRRRELAKKKKKEEKARKKQERKAEKEEINTPAATEDVEPEDPSE